MLMDVNVRSLANFRRFLAMPGATVQVIRNDWSNPAKTIHPIVPKAGYWEPKHVVKVQSNGVYFTQGWLAFPKSANAKYDGDTVTLCMQQDGTFANVLVYKLTRDGYDGNAAGAGEATT